jgi:hypothetical protein
VAFDPSFYPGFQPIPGYDGPVEEALVDADNDGWLDTAYAAGEGGGPRVRVIDGKDGSVQFDGFVPGVDIDFRGGLHLTSAGGKLVATAGPGGGPVVNVFSVDGAFNTTFLAYDEGFRGGVLANGIKLDVDGDGVPSDVIVTTTESDGAPLLKVFDVNGELKRAFFIGPEDDRSGNWQVIGAGYGQDGVWVSDGGPDVDQYTWGGVYVG